MLPFLLYPPFTQMGWRQSGCLVFTTLAASSLLACWTFLETGIWFKEKSGLNMQIPSHQLVIGLEGQAIRWVHKRSKFIKRKVLRTLAYGSLKLRIQRNEKTSAKDTNMKEAELEKISECPRESEDSSPLGQRFNSATPGQMERGIWCLYLQQFAAKTQWTLDTGYQWGNYSCE